MHVQLMRSTSCLTSDPANAGDLLKASFNCFPRGSTENFLMCEILERRLEFSYLLRDCSPEWCLHAMYAYVRYRVSRSRDPSDNPNNCKGVIGT